MSNYEFPLSEKYIDFMKSYASAEFLEGTTSAGKTTVAIPKFMFNVSKIEPSGKKVTFVPVPIVSPITDNGPVGAPRLYSWWCILPFW